MAEQAAPACHPGVMQTFKVRLWERLESPPQEPFGGVVEPSFRAPGRMVLVVREGTAWIQREDSISEKTASARRQHQREDSISEKTASARPPAPRAW